MRDTRGGDRATFFLMGAAVGAAVALLVAPTSDVRTRRKLLGAHDPKSVPWVGVYPLIISSSRSRRTRGDRRETRPFLTSAV